MAASETMTESELFSIDQRADTWIVTPRMSTAGLDEAQILEETGRLAERVGRLPAPDLVVDLRHMSYLGSGMLEALLTLRGTLITSGGRVVMCNVGVRSGKILELARFDELWPVFASRDDALAWIPIGPDGPKEPADSRQAAALA
jgi:anti-anti-sigma regulatory factor